VIMLVEVEKTGLIIGTVLQMTWEKVERLLRTVEDVTTEVLVFVLVTWGMGQYFDIYIRLILDDSLTDVSRGNRAGGRGSSWLERGVNRRDNSRLGAGPGRRLPDRGRYNGGDRFCRSLLDRGVHSRARG
jgi:hypothetical protein